MEELMDGYPRFPNSKRGPVFPGSVIIFLIVGVIACMFGSLMLHSMIVSFDSRCILDAKLNFEEKKPATEKPYQFENISTVVSANASSVNRNGITDLSSFFPGVFDKTESSEVNQFQLDFVSKSEFHFII
jgi:hypothetical protein